MMREMEFAEHAQAIGACQKILRLSTAIILVAFVLIIAMTTVSTGGLVLVLGKVLYWVIVGCALISLGTWYYRTRLEKKQEKHAA